MPRIAVIGAGSYGTALGGILAENGYDIDYYDPEKEKERLKDVVDGAKAILVSAPSDVVMKLLFHLPQDKFLIVATKGFLSCKPFAEFSDWAILSGAGFADDIKNKKRVHLTATDQRVIDLFKTDSIAFDQTNDKLGVLMCGALKNVYAIRAGELGLKPNTKRKENYVGEVTEEMAVILAENGAKPSTLKLACGVKDLYLTCGENSRNYQFGKTRTNHEKVQNNMTVEGLAALKRIRRGEIIVPDKAKILQLIMEESEEWD